MIQIGQEEISKAPVHFKYHRNVLDQRTKNWRVARLGRVFRGTKIEQHTTTRGRLKGQNAGTMKVISIYNIPCDCL